MLLLHCGRRQTEFGSCLVGLCFLKRLGLCIARLARLLRGLRFVRLKVVLEFVIYDKVSYCFNGKLNGCRWLLFVMNFREVWWYVRFYESGFHLRLNFDCIN